MIQMSIVKDITRTEIECQQELQEAFAQCQVSIERIVGGRPCAAQPEDEMQSINHRVEARRALGEAFLHAREALLLRMRPDPRCVSAFQCRGRCEC